MANGSVFTPTIETPVAQQQVVSPVRDDTTATAIRGLTPFISEGVKVGIAFNEQSKLEAEFGEIDEELKSLDSQFKSIDQAIKSGGTKGALQMRARSALKSAVASSPILKSKADALYSQYFGGAGASGQGTSGAFSLSPHEQQAQKVGAEIADLELLGYSRDKAMAAVQASRAAEMAKNQADLLANQAKVQEYQVAPIVDSLLVGRDTQAQSQILAHLKTNGTFNPEDKLLFERQLDAQALQLKRQIQKAALNPDGSYSIDASSVQAKMDRVDQQTVALKQMLTDSASLKLVEESNRIANAQVNLAVVQNFPQALVMKKALGDEAFNGFMQALSTGNARQLAFIKAQMPEISEVLGKEFNFTEGLTVKASAKLFEPTNREPLGQMEKVAVGSFMGSNAQYAMEILGKADASQLAGITSVHPQALASTYSPKTQSVRSANKAMANPITEMQRGAMNNFNDLFRTEFGRFPSELEIIIQQQDPQTRLSAETPYVNFSNVPRRIMVNSADGAQLSQEMVNIVADIFRSIEANPETIPEELRGKGLSPAQIATIWINSGMNPENLKFFEPLTEEVNLREDRGFNYRTQQPQEAQADVTEEN